MKKSILFVAIIALTSLVSCGGGTTEVKTVDSTKVAVDTVKKSSTDSVKVVADSAKKAVDTKK